MAKSIPSLSRNRLLPFETSIHIDDGSPHEGICVNLENVPPWIRNYVPSPLLDLYKIFHLGLVDANTRYRVSRVQSPFTHFEACIAGEAVVWVGGKYHRLTPGTACLLPKGTSYLIQPQGDANWQFCYVCYRHPHGTGFRGVNQARFGAYDPFPLQQAIRALHHECAHASDGECQRQLLGVINHLVQRFAGLRPSNERFELGWQRVTAQPAKDWSLEQLSKEMSCHPEHLRRQCQHYFGHSPGQQVAIIRMQHAAELLCTTGWTLEHIASQVGYADAFSFSSAFKKWFHLSPAHYRTQHLGQLHDAGGMRP